MAILGTNPARSNGNFTFGRRFGADTHVSEPPHLWTSRLPSKWAERAPRIEWDDKKEQEVWVIDGNRATPIGVTATAGLARSAPRQPADVSENPACPSRSPTRARGFRSKQSRRGQGQARDKGSR